MTNSSITLESKEGKGNLVIELLLLNSTFCFGAYPICVEEFDEGTKEKS